MKHYLEKKNEIELNSMKKIKIDDTPILLIRTKDDNYYAIGAECTHYGAPLETGVLNGNRIVCPWHHACFNCTDGKMIEPPALDDLEQYPLTIDEDKIYIEIPDKNKNKIKTNIEINDERTFVIIGTGAAGGIAAKTLRKEGFAGKLILISKDTMPPYDRTNLTKAFLKGSIKEDELPLKSDNYFDDISTELMLNKEITNLDALTKIITLDDGKNIKYDKILIATGGTPKVPFIEGTELNNVFTLRNYEDAELIIDKSQNNKKCVIIGSSFIAMETASSLQEHNIEVTVITKESIPFANVFGEELGKIFLEAHKKNNTHFIFNDEPISFKGSDKVEGVELKSGKVIDTDMVIIGVGVKPATKFVKGLHILEDESIEVDEYFNAGKDVFAAGDIAAFPYWRSNEKIRIEHWRTALQQGIIAAKNMLGKNVKYKSIPFFWTKQAGITLQYAGHADNWDQVFVEGNINDSGILAYFVTSGKVNAVAGIGRTKQMAAIEELMRLNKMPKNIHLAQNEFNPVELLNDLTHKNNGENDG